MVVQLFRTATEYLSNTLTIQRGTVDNIISVGIFHTQNPLYVPSESDFQPALLVLPGDSLAQGNNIDIVSLIGPGAGAHDTLSVGDWQRWVLIKTVSETIIRRKDTVVVT